MSGFLVYFWQQFYTQVFLIVCEFATFEGSDRQRPCPCGQQNRYNRTSSNARLAPACVRPTASPTAPMISISRFSVTPSPGSREEQRLRLAIAARVGGHNMTVKAARPLECVGIGGLQNDGVLAVCPRIDRKNPRCFAGQGTIPR